MRLRDAAPSAGVFVVALAWLLLLRPYGFQLEDEGTLLSWFDRVVAGQQPYTGFHTGYTPGFFAFGSGVFGAFGTSVLALRAVLAVVNALAAAILTELTRRVSGNWLAPIPALVWLAFVPVYAGEFAAFNIPYPTWPVTLAWMVLSAALLSWAERPRPAVLAVAGVVAAATMWLRPNAGAFALAAATWVVVAFAPRRSLVDRAAAVVGAAFMAAGVWYAFGVRVPVTDAVVHLLPAFALATLFAGPLAARLERSEGAGTVASLLTLAAAFLVPTLAWSMPLLFELGLERFLYEVFLVGAGYQELYYKAHPAPEPFAMFVVASIVMLALAGRMVSRGTWKPLRVLLVFAVVGGAAKLVLLRNALAPEGVLHSVVAQLENASYWLAVTASFGAVAWLWRARGAELQASARARALVVLTPLAVAMYAQMFPRSDFMHQITAVPLLAALACGLLDRVCAWWASGDWPSTWNGSRAVRGGVLAAAASILALVFLEKLPGPLEAFRNAAPQSPISERLDVRVEAAAGDELEAVAATVAFLRDHTTEGDLLWSFPATSGVLFAAGRRNLAPHDYWYPGRPDHSEETRVLGMLEKGRPPYIVTINRGWNFFSGAAAYFENLRRFARTNYTLAARFGRYDVLARRDLPASPTIVIRKSGSIDAVIDANLERRRQATWRWMDSMTPAEAERAALPAGRLETLLLLRGLRDGGDMRGAGWAILGFESTDARVRGEAADAMLALARSLGDARHRLAGDFKDAGWKPFAEPWAERARPLAAIPALRPFAEAVLELAGGQVAAAD